VAIGCATTSAVPTIGDIVTVRVEVPRGSFVKRGADGAFEYASPLPSPFNYGSLPGTVAADGEGVDAVLLGPTLRAGAEVRAEVLGVVRFIDAGLPDEKLVCGAPPLSDADRRTIARFFRRYARLKWVVHRLRRKTGRTAFDGLDLPP
jgi:inorganic pyrophosphatase